MLYAFSFIVGMTVGAALMVAFVRYVNREITVN